MGVKAKCKHCGREADSEMFKLHYKYRMMVCADCFTGKTDRDRQKKEASADPRTGGKPPGWDSEDEYLEKMSRMKQQQTVSRFQPILGTKLYQCTCIGCNYNFKFDPLKNMPQSCPYCNEPVPKFKGSVGVNDLF